MPLLTLAEPNYRRQQPWMLTWRFALLQLYKEYVPEDFWQYCWDMERDGNWGDHVTLQAAADAYGVPINILTSYQDSCFVNLTPRAERISDRALYLSFFAEVHYNSLYPAADPPAREKIFGSKTLYRWFGSRHQPELAA